MSGSKKRRAGDDGGDDFLENVSPDRTHRAPRRAVRPPSGTTYYLENCVSLRHQYMEDVNAQYAEAMQAQEIDRFFYSAEYMRIVRELEGLYGKFFPGDIYTCGIDEGTGCLGYEATDYNNVFRKVQQLRGVVQVDAGSLHNGILDKDGRAYTFGTNENGQLGRDGASHETMRAMQVIGFCPYGMARKRVPDILDHENDCIVKIICGNLITVFITIHGNVYVCGSFRHYEDTNLCATEPRKDDPQEEFPIGSNHKPTLVDVPFKVKDVAVGNYAAILLSEDGQAFSFGVGTKGELGREVPEYFSKTEEHYDVKIMLEHCYVPRPVSGLSGLVVISVACGELHFMLVARENSSLVSTVYGCGFNADYQLGLPDSLEERIEPRKVPVPLPYTTGMNIAQVRCGAFHTVAMDVSCTRIFACGRAGTGQCGIGELDAQAENVVLIGREHYVKTLSPVAFPERNLRFDKIECGEHHNLVIANPTGGRPRQLYTWGQGDTNGCLGHGMDKDEMRPRQVVKRNLQGKKGNLQGVIRDVAGGANHSVLLLSEQE